MFSPIILFVYNRPEHMKKVVSSLKKNKEASKSELYIFSDGARKEEDIIKVSLIRDYIKKVKGFKKLTIIESEKNKGLSRSIIEGVTEIVNLKEKAIVLEDDIKTGKYFLQFMNKALDLYSENDNVAAVHGYMYPIKEKLPETFFLRFADCWGWGTWKRSWDRFQTNGKILYEQLKKNKIIHKFDFDDNYPYSNMLMNQIKGRNDSWAIRWYANLLINNNLGYFPGRSLVKNIGMDNTGRHCTKIGYYEVKKINNKINAEILNVKENMGVRNALENYFKNGFFKNKN